jgi:hypothetical protein
VSFPLLKFCTWATEPLIRFSADPSAPYPTPLYFGFEDYKMPFDFYDNDGNAYTLSYDESIVHPQWGNEYYYTGGGHALSFSCPSNHSGSPECAGFRYGNVTCNCSSLFASLLPPPSPTEDASTFLDEFTRALDVSFLVYSPSLQSYVFVHYMFEFSETGALKVWDDYQSFSGRYSKQFDFSERFTTLRISQYITCFYALIYLFYERTDWNSLRFKIPDVSFPFFV